MAERVGGGHRRRQFAPAHSEVFRAATGAAAIALPRGGGHRVGMAGSQRQLAPMREIAAGHFVAGEEAA